MKTSDISCCAKRLPVLGALSILLVGSPILAFAAGYSSAREGGASSSMQRHFVLANVGASEPRKGMAESGGARLLCSANRGALNLQGLVGVAVDGYPSILSKRAEVVGARSDVDSARWQYFPTPSTQVRQDTGTGGNTTVVALQQPLWAGGRLDAGLDLAQAKARSAEVAVTEAQFSLAVRVVTSYQSWLQAKGRTSAMAKSVAMLEGYAERMRRRIEGGVSADVDRELVASRVAQAKGDLTAAKASERVAMGQLAQLVGMPLGAGDLACMGEADVGDLGELNELIEQGVRRFPSLRRMDADIEAAGHEVAVRRSSVWPTLVVRGEYQHADATSSLYKDSNERRVLLALDYAPGAGLSATSAIGAAEARAAGARLGRDAVRRDLVDRMGNDYEDLASGRQRKQELLRTMRAAAEVLASYDRLFVAGKRGWLDVLNAARELTQVEISLADIEAQIVATGFRLRLYSGEPLWRIEEGVRNVD